MRLEGTDAASLQRIRGFEPIVVPVSSAERNINADWQQGSVKLNDSTVIDAIEKANKAIVISGRQLEFSIHEKTKEIMVKVIDTETKEVIREIPPEKILDMVACILEMAGILVDERR